LPTPDLTLWHWSFMRTLITIITAALTASLITINPAQADGLNRIEIAARDMNGYQPSLYQGKWYSPRHEAFRKCIMKRESHYNYRAANKSSSARGAYQFLDRSWRVPLTHMMIKEDKKLGGYRVEEIRDLRTIPINKWNRYWQDRAFWTAFRYGDGKHHWSYSGSSCNRLA